MDSGEETPRAEIQRCVRTTRLVVWGMVCPNCATRIHGYLIACVGVMEVHADHTVGMVQVVYNADLITIPDLINAVVRAGSDGWHTYGASVSHVLPSGFRRCEQD